MWPRLVSSLQAGLGMGCCEKAAQALEDNCGAAKWARLGSFRYSRQTPNGRHCAPLLFCPFVQVESPLFDSQEPLEGLLTSPGLTRDLNLVRP